MDAKKTIMQFIKPNIVPTIILLLIPPFFTVIGLIILLAVILPTYNKAKKNIAKLEAEGKLNAAAAEITSPNAKRYVAGKVIMTDNYIFCKGSGMILTYDDILWAYKYKHTTTVLFIPVKVNESLFLATSTMKPTSVATMGKDKMEEIKNAILEIYSHNNRCMVGYTDANAANYKAMRQ